MKLELDVIAVLARTIEDDIQDVAPNVRLNRFVYPNQHNGHATIEIEGDEADLADLTGFWGFEWDDISSTA